MPSGAFAFQEGEAEMSIVTSYGCELQDPFVREDGTRVTSRAEWPARRAELAKLVQTAFYGTLPPAPESAPEVECILDRDFPASYLIYPFANDNFSLCLRLWIPRHGKGPWPVVIDGDACWHSISDERALKITDAGYALAYFDRCQVVPDIPAKDRSSRFERRFPGSDFGAVAAWAWGFHRVIDALPFIGKPLDLSKIVVVGHSRGGKASLLAGALDERVAIVAANASGSGGAGCWRFGGEDAEPLDAMLDVFPTWFSPVLEQFRGRQQDLPIDHHFVKALCAPRPLFIAESVDDQWANPPGCCLTNRAAREVYRFLGCDDTFVGTHFRTGPHGHKDEDWAALLQFCDYHFFGKPAVQNFLREPYKDLPQAFSWRAPGS